MTEAVATPEKQTRSPADELKALLVGPERLAIDTLRERVNAISLQLESPEAFSELVSDVINRSILELDERERGAFITTLARLMANPVRREIRNAEPQIMQALYPVADALVKQGVDNAMAKMQSSLNQKLRKRLSVFSALTLRLRALVSGRSVAELMLLDNPDFKVNDLILVDRQSGLVIAGVSGDPTVANADANSQEQDRIAALLSALEVFAKDALKQGDASPNETTNSTLKRLKTDEAELFIEAAPSFTMAARVSGTAPKLLGLQFGSLFKDLIKKWSPALRDSSGAPDPSLIEDLNKDLLATLVRLNDPEDLPANPWVKRITIALIGLSLFLLAAFVTNSVWHSKRVETVKSAIDKVEPLRRYNLSYERQNGELIVRGMVQNQDDVTKLENLLLNSYRPGDFNLQLVVLSAR